MSEDGVTPYYKELLTVYPPALEAFRAHGPCIDAIRESGVKHVIFCPGYMRSLGKKSENLPDSLNIRINRPSGSFISYEDAAYVMVNAAETNDYDNELITASTTIVSE